MAGRTGGGKEVLSIAAVGVGMAALGLGALAAAPWVAPLGVAAGAALGSSFARRPKPPARPADVRRDDEGRVENWAQLLRAVQHGVSEEQGGFRVGARCPACACCLARPALRHAVLPRRSACAQPCCAPSPARPTA